MRELLERYGDAVFYIAIERDGSHSLGSAFHVGDGLLMTARHVVESSTITCIGRSDPMGFRTHLIGDPLFHPNPRVDVAILRTELWHR